jgi:membrane protease YdiL (CAAX protease family)
MSAPLQQLLGALLVACLPVGIIVYAQLLRHLARKGPRVKTAFVALPDVLVALVLVTFLLVGIAGAAAAAGRAPDAAGPRLTIGHVLPNVAIFLGAFVLLLAFLQVRGVDLRRFFGAHALRPGRVAILATGFIAAAFPLLLLIGSVSQYALGQRAQEQELIGIFRDAAVRTDLSALALLTFAAAVSQPLVEEVFFRGYFYVIGKRFLGALPSALLTSALFAAVHFNLTAFPALLFLALCLTLAYEVTGSLLVPIGMHAVFNASQLLILAWQAHGIPAP